MCYYRVSSDAHFVGIYNMHAYDMYNIWVIMRDS